ncbi:ATP-binding protein [Lyngbya aestuarii]|uniref:ATP-binding protein n=1 Tax=Lyngbya aestuarii TaxID=118322 RepID=UPI00403D93E7
MKFPSWLPTKLSLLQQKIDPFSLQFRLTVGTVAVSTLVLSSAAILTSWKMQQILVTSQKHHIKYVAERFPQDLAIYNDMVPLENALQRAVDNLTTGDILLWVRNSDGSIVSQSEALQVNRYSSLLTTQKQLIPRVYEMKRRYWVICGTPLLVKGKMLGKVYVAKDITSEQTMLISLMRTLGFTSFFSILAITIVLAIYIERSLQPLCRISQLTKTISADDLGQARIHLDHAPSEVRELAQTVDKMLVRLFDAWEQQRQFVSNVSHELRTPLTIVSGYLQSTLRRGNNLTGLQREALLTASSEADRTIQLLQDLLDLARADNGQMHFNLEPLVLNELVAEVVSMAEQYSQREIKLEEATSLIEMKADRDRLKQVLLNLIDNAVKYSHPGTAITVKLSQLDEQVTIQVCDQGSGIPLQQQSRIFERFYRVDEARARSSGGTGLGLSIVKTLVEGMGGYITVRSKLDEGSVFTVALPALSSNNLQLLPLSTK